MKGYTSQTINETYPSLIREVLQISSYAATPALHPKILVVDWHCTQNKILEVYKLFLEKVRGTKLIFQINSILTNIFIW